MKDEIVVNGKLVNVRDFIQQGQAVIDVLNEEVEMLRPKGEFHDAVTQSDDTKDMAQVAKMLNVKGDRE